MMDADRADACQMWLDMHANEIWLCSIHSLVSHLRDAIPLFSFRQNLSLLDSAASEWHCKKQQQHAQTQMLVALASLATNPFQTRQMTQHCKAHVLWTKNNKCQIHHQSVVDACAHQTQTGKLVILELINHARPSNKKFHNCLNPGKIQTTCKSRSPTTA
mmetsp:Transcript_13287/g.22117  ORF Transcript_13287/g.22117 Transcript_13287/m.22117 type:complete len:160 (-) Transcript_13287:591-1070(-)